MSAQLFENMAELLVAAYLRDTNRDQTLKEFEKESNVTADVTTLTKLIILNTLLCITYIGHWHLCTLMVPSEFEKEALKQT